jgi:hypothetical protein
VLAQPSKGAQSWFWSIAADSGGHGRKGMPMVGWCGITGITRIAQCCDGLWRFLIARAMARTAVELERERNRATAEVIRLLPIDCELLEYEPDGRLRVIRRSGLATTAPAVPGETLREGER